MYCNLCYFFPVWSTVVDKLGKINMSLYSSDLVILVANKKKVNSFDNQVTVSCFSRLSLHSWVDCVTIIYAALPGVIMNRVLSLGFSRGLSFRDTLC